MVRRGRGTLTPGLRGGVIAQSGPQEGVGTKPLYTRHQGGNIRREMEGRVCRVEERGRGAARDKAATGTSSHGGTGGTNTTAGYNRRATSRGRRRLEKGEREERGGGGGRKEREKEQEGGDYNSKFFLTTCIFTISLTLFTNCT